MLEIENLDVSIGSVNILRGVRMSVGEGKFVGLIGRNGAGKTTLMRAIMGILPAKAGSLRFQGQAFERVATHLRARAGIGYMPEDRRLVPTLTVEENVALGRLAGPDRPARYLANVRRELVAHLEVLGLAVQPHRQRLTDPAISLTDRSTVGLAASHALDADVPRIIDRVARVDRHVRLVRGHRNHPFPRHGARARSMDRSVPDGMSSPP